MESAAVADFLEDVTHRPSALVFDGEAGMGKTTVWLSAVEQARNRGMTVLSARGSPAESVLAYAALADLLSDVDTAALETLPEPQRRGLARALLLDTPDEVASDPRAVAAGFLSLIETMATDSPVLVAIDDLQWVDASSAAALAFACPRLSGALGVLCTARTDPRGDSTVSLLRMPRPDHIRRVQVQPLSLGALHTILTEQYARTYSRPMMVRIHEISAGNPLFALELARSVGNAATLADVPLPGTLAEVVQKRIGALDAELQRALLAAACVASPTVELTARATDMDSERAVTLLEIAESKGIIGVNGHRVRFTHPMLARAIYTEAASAERRAMHRRLAKIVDGPELRARHLALGATTGDSLTLQSLDEAAESARMRGAPAAAAELIDLAIDLGGDTPQRQIVLARNHFNAGDHSRAGAVLQATIRQLPPGVLRAEATSLFGYVRLLDDSFLEAADLLQHALPEAVDHPAVLVPMLVTLSFALFNADHVEPAFHRADEAVTNAEQYGDPGLLSQALSMRAMVAFLRGDGIDELSMRRALELEDQQAPIPMALRASAHHALLRSSLGELDLAHAEFTRLRRRCVDQGDDGDLMFVAFHAALNEIWRGDLTEAALIIENSVELAQQLGGDVSLSVSLSARAVLAAYAGRVDEARADAAAARAASLRSGSARLGEWPTNAVGFLEVSVGNYGAALAALEPMSTRFKAAPNATEMITAWSAPDVVEAMVNLGQHDSAEPLVAMLEHNGRRVDRPWMLATGARCRAMVLAARGDVAAAVPVARQAMVEHERLPMPFERARTQLVLGKLLRRKRLKDAGAAVLREALDTFEQLGTPLWADRVRAELGRANIGPRASAVLTPSEQRVAELAATGMTNRNIAAQLFISPKTVEANLSRVYNKLGIHSRAELGRHMSRLGQ